jgi:hypothetical protein
MSSACFQVRSLEANHQGAVAPGEWWSLDLPSEEEVIRIFTQHYKTFCGFESIETAELYLGVFEKVYRCTPFSADAQERIRGKCPLELAGYEIQKLPMARLFRGLALQWPAAAFQELVPNV